jgi:hypothetical protein
MDFKKTYVQSLLKKNLIVKVWRKISSNQITDRLHYGI